MRMILTATPICGLWMSRQPAAEKWTLLAVKTAYKRGHKKEMRESRIFSNDKTEG